MLANAAEAFSGVFGPLYTDGTLHRTGLVDNGKGTMSKAAPADIPVKVQIDRLTQRQRDGEFAEDDVRLIVLAAGLKKWLPNGRLQDDDEITVPTVGITYRIAGPSLDPLGSHWECRGRIKPRAVPA
jgi:hypothetical protein